MARETSQPVNPCVTVSILRSFYQRPGSSGLLGGEIRASLGEARISSAEEAGKILDAGRMI